MMTIQSKYQVKSIMMDKKEKNGAYYRQKIKDQGRTVKWCAEQLGLSGPALSMKLREAGTKLRKWEKKGLDSILGLEE